MRVATRAGLRREGVLRGHGDRRTTAARTRWSSPGSRPTRPPPRPAGFRALLNSFLPRKRAIAQMLVRDNDGRVLLCRLTYKNDFDLPGGVVEVGESPQVAVAREVEEELGFDIEGGRAAGHRLAAAVGRLGRRALPGLRRRRRRRVRARRGRAAGTRDPLGTVLHARRGARATAPTSPHGGSRPRCARSRAAARRTPSPAAPDKRGHLRRHSSSAVHSIHTHSTGTATWRALATCV